MPPCGAPPARLEPWVAPVRRPTGPPRPLGRPRGAPHAPAAGPWLAPADLQDHPARDIPADFPRPLLPRSSPAALPPQPLPRRAPAAPRGRPAPGPARPLGASAALRDQSSVFVEGPAPIASPGDAPPRPRQPVWRTFPQEQPARMIPARGPLRRPSSPASRPDQAALFPRSSSTRHPDAPVPDPRLPPAPPPKAARRPPPPPCPGPGTASWRLCGFARSIQRLRRRTSAHRLPRGSPARVPRARARAPASKTSQHASFPLGLVDEPARPRLQTVVPHEQSARAISARHASAPLSPGRPPARTSCRSRRAAGCGSAAPSGPRLSRRRPGRRGARGSRASLSPAAAWCLRTRRA
jgi:hypothetical protein